MTLVDRDNRRKAMTDFTSVLLVEAAAGTGKTSLMAGRVAMMLAHGHQPGEIAAITFTELAASQLARRIKETVEALVSDIVPAFLEPALPNGLTPEQRTSLSDAASRLDELTVTTIHGFCQALIQAHGVQAGLDPGARVVDETVADALFLGEVSAWFSRQLAAEASASDPIAVLAEKIPLKVVKLVRELASLRRKHPGAAPPVPAQNARPDIEFAQAVEDFDRWQADVANERWAPEIAQELTRLGSRYKDSFDEALDFARLWDLCDAGSCRIFTAKGLELKSYGEAAEVFGAYADEWASEAVVSHYQVVRAGLGSTHRARLLLAGLRAIRIARPSPRKLSAAKARWRCTGF
jgi:CRISPR-associated exonuclease Cas4